MPLKRETVQWHELTITDAAGAAGVSVGGAGGGGGAVTLNTDAAALLTLVEQQLGLVEQAANRVFASPDAAGGVPTFRAFFDSESPSSITPSTAGGPGIATTAARRDHIHPASAAAPSFSFGISGAEGSATTFVRSDATLAVFEATVPSTVVPGSAAAGSAGKAARRDHIHGIGTAAPSTNLSVSSSNTEGSGNDFARAAHVHAITSSSNPGAAASILASSASGYLQLKRIGLDIAPEVPLHTASGSGPALRVAYNDSIYSDFECDSQNNLILSTPTATTGGAIDLWPTGDLITRPGGKDILPGLPYDVNIGAPFKKYLTLHVAELWVETLVAQEVMATIGGRILVAPTAQLTRDLGTSDTTIYLSHNDATTNDTIYLEARGKVEFMLVTSARPSDASELLANNGFEAGSFTSWTTSAGDGAVAVQSTYKNSGTYAARLTSGSTSNTYAYQAESVSAGQVYTLALYHANNGVLGGRVGVYNATASNWIIPLKEMPTTGSVFDHWTTKFTIPSGCSSIRIYLYCPLQNTRIAYFDDVSLKRQEYSYTVTRNRDGTGANWWFTGDAVVSLGNAGDGWIDLYSMRGVHSRGYGPTICGNIRNSTTYNDWNEFWAIGNLNGLYGYSSDTPGMAVGKYANGQPYITVDSSGGIKIMHRSGGANTQLAQWDTSGNILVGQAASGKSNVYITAGKVALRTNTTEHITLEADGDVFIGENTAAAATTNLALFTNAQTYNSESMAAGDFLIGDNGSGKANILWKKAEGRLRFRGGTTTQSYIDTNGFIVAGGGNVWIGTSGIDLLGGTGAANEVTWLIDSSTAARVGGYAESTKNYAIVSSKRTGSKDGSSLYLKAGEGSAVETGISIHDFIPSGKQYMMVFSVGGYTAAHIRGDRHLVAEKELWVTETLRAYGNIDYDSGSLTPYLTDTYFYGYTFVPLKQPLTSSTYNGNAFSNYSTTVRSLSNLFEAAKTVSSVNTSTEYITLTTTHEWDANTAVKVRTTGTLPGGLVAGTVYYVRAPSGATLQLSTAPGGEAVNITSAGSGTHTVYQFMPANVKAVLIQIIARDSATWGTDGLYFSVGPSATYWYAVSCRPKGGDVQDEVLAPVPTTSGGNLYFTINASGTSTLDAWVRIWGYWV
jgi:hypothetical protein